MSDLDLFAAATNGLDASHFGLTESGDAYVVAAPFAKALGYSGTHKAMELLDEDEKGHLNRVTPGGNQRVGVIYEAGLWRLIFRSNLPSARSLTKHVTEILRQLRETGVVDTRPPRELTRLELIDLARDAEVGRLAAEERVAELEPAAASWGQLAEASGDFSVREAAQILNRDPSIATGQRRLFAFLKAEGWLAPGGVPYQRHVDIGRLALKVGSFEKNDGESVVTRQVRVTVKGLHDLHQRLGGTGRLMFAA